jgi:hypothetical protein
VQPRDTGPAGYFLGFNIYRDRSARKLYMSQEHYFQSVLERFDLQDCNPARTPLPTGFRCHGATSTNKEPVVSDVYGRLSSNSLSED